MIADLLQIQMLGQDFPPRPTYLPVLAIDTTHIAPGEEDIADTVLAGNNRLFTAMGADRRNGKPSPTVAVAVKAVETIGVTFPRTAGAIFERRKRLKDRIGES